MDYKDTLHLPKTDFPMKASLPQQEPGRLKFWEEKQIFEQLLEKNKNAKKFILHDGPPYANGGIHFGHILNKVLKDIIVKQKNLAGFYSPYVPGWDCHGLPIELGALKELGEKQKIDPRTADKNTRIQACRDYAHRFIDEQKSQFKRLGIFGDWEHPYLTLDKKYEADTAQQFLELYLKGFVTESLKPVHWCTSCRTALAEAEVEYENVSSPSIYVKFEIDGSKLNLKLRTQDSGLRTSLVIWTTTPWTLPANVALAVGENFLYDAIDLGDEIIIVAQDLKSEVLKQIGRNESSPTVLTISGPELVEKVKEAKHPFLNRSSRIVIGHHVTLEAGTGIVHIAPGHGQDDFVIGLKEKLAVLCPVDAGGCFYAENASFTDDNTAEFKETVSGWVGMFYKKANKEILAFLSEKKILLSDPAKSINHPYPHCWRCKNPIIFRATEQWFCSLEHNSLRTNVLKAIDEKVKWIPDWGRNRIYGMIENRPDWCLSRQRTWGVPIIIHKCVNCHKQLLTREIGEFIVAAIREKGIEAWHESATPLLPPNTQCPSCKGEEFVKDGSILDVWFDSGISHAAVLRRRPELSFPADLYLEGSDQHRGWFHSSLLTSMAINETPPYKAVLTHGFVVDGQGKKYSKSAKNYTPPEKILDQYGAELLRLWVAAEDYRNDIRVSDEIIKVLAEIYRKIRNTYRFVLGNLSDFDPKTQWVEYKDRTELDHYALHLLSELVEKIETAYEKYEFHVVHHALNKFFTVDLSAFYLDILKDRLYCDAKSSKRRLSAQATMYEILVTTLPLLAPILSFTAEEIWSFVVNKKESAESVFLLPWPKVKFEWKNQVVFDRYQRIGKVRDDVLKQLEVARKNKEIGHGLDAKVILSASGPTKDLLKQYESEWPQIFITSQTAVQEDLADGLTGEFCADLKVKIVKAEGAKCERCWNYSLEVGKNATHPTLCNRCSEAV